MVTAQRRQERLQAVPISIVVLQGKELEQSGYRSATDLQYLASGVQYDPANGGAYQIRGVGTETYDPSAEQSVSTVVDDVVIDAPHDLGITALNDVNRIEVLKGPQGTLFGKNATSGVVSVNTDLPKPGVWSDTFDLDYGSRLDRYVTDTLNVPIGEHSALRVTAFEQGQDGFGDNRYTDNTVGAFRSEGVRARLLSETIDDLQIVLNGDYEHNFNDNTAFPVALPANETKPLEAFGINPGRTNDQTADPNDTSATTRSYGGSLHVNYEFGGQTITSVSAYRNTAFNENFPLDFVPSPLFLPANHSFIDTGKVSQELRIASPTGHFLEYVGGFFFNHLTANGSLVQYGDVGIALPPGTFISTAGARGLNQDLTHTNLDTKAFFGQLKFNLTRRMSISVGGRYTLDDNSEGLGFGHAPVAYDLINIYGPPLKPFGEARHNNFSYSIHAQYQFTSDIMGYATYATGYKAPGVAFTDNIYDPYKAETAKDYEVGVKSEFLDRRVRLNVDLFRESYTDFQAQVLTPQPSGLAAYVTGNAGGLRSQGVEAQSAVQPIPALSLSADATYADAAYTNYVDGANVFTGRPLTNAPRWSLTFAADYKRPVLDGYMFGAHAEFSYRTDVYTQVGQAYSLVPGFGLLGGRISLGPDHGPWTIGIYARNLLDQRFTTSFQNINGILRLTDYEAYRTVGGFLSYRF